MSKKRKFLAYEFLAIFYTFEGVTIFGPLRDICAVSLYWKVTVIWKTVVVGVLICFFKLVECITDTRCFLDHKTRSVVLWLSVRVYVTVQSLAGRQQKRRKKAFLGMTVYGYAFALYPLLAATHWGWWWNPRGHTLLCSLCCNKFYFLVLHSANALYSLLFFFYRLSHQRYTLTLPQFLWYFNQIISQSIFTSWLWRLFNTSRCRRYYIRISRLIATGSVLLLLWFHVFKQRRKLC